MKKGVISKFDPFKKCVLFVKKMITPQLLMSIIDKTSTGVRGSVYWILKKVILQSKWLFLLIYVFLKIFIQQEKCESFDERTAPIEDLIAKGEELMSQCPAQATNQVSERVKRLKERWTDTKDRAAKKKVQQSHHHIYMI